MFIYSIRSQTIKFICTVVLAVAAMVTLIALIPTYDVEASSEGLHYSEIYDNNDRINFISQFGWTVNETPLEEISVTIPDEFDTVYVGYNEMQKDQGLNLAKYKGKDVTRYTYNVTNYKDYEGEVYVNLLVYRGKVVGGDVCSADSSGFVHGFSQEVKYTY